jgi:hypothetical protein
VVYEHYRNLYPILKPTFHALAADNTDKIRI